MVDNTTTWLVDLQQQFGLATKPGFPIEVIYMQSVNAPKHPVASLQLAVHLKWPQAVFSFHGKQGNMPNSASLACRLQLGERVSLQQKWLSPRQ